MGVRGRSFAPEGQTPVAMAVGGTRQKRSLVATVTNQGVYHCKPGKAWLAKPKAQLEVFYLPSYSPEFNPEARLNADLKRVIRTKEPVKTKAKLQAAAFEHMTARIHTPERVRTFFQDLPVQYAA